MKASGFKDVKLDKAKEGRSGPMAACMRDGGKIIRPTGKED